MRIRAGGTVLATVSAWCQHGDSHAGLVLTHRAQRAPAMTGACARPR